MVKIRTECTRSTSFMGPRALKFFFPYMSLRESIRDLSEGTTKVLVRPQLSKTRPNEFVKFMKGADQTALHKLHGCSNCELAKTFAEGKLPIVDERSATYVDGDKVAWWTIAKHCPAILAALALYDEQLITGKFLIKELEESAGCYKAKMVFRVVEGAK